MKAYKLLETAVLPTDVLKAKAIHNDMWTQEAVEGRFGSMLQKKLAMRSLLTLPNSFLAVSYST
ncbi:hypothetical protein QW180_20645 [Vibrio sinaloensis]|nr:hypothetical protein [Vibrio sinaloensis]